MEDSWSQGLASLYVSQLRGLTTYRLQTTAVPGFGCLYADPGSSIGLGNYYERLADNKWLAYIDGFAVDAAWDCLEGSSALMLGFWSDM